MRLSGRTPLDVRIAEMVNSGERVDEILREAILFLTLKRQVTKFAKHSGISYNTLMKFANNDDRDMRFRTLEDAFCALGYRLTLERL